MVIEAFADRARPELDATGETDQAEIARRAVGIPAGQTTTGHLDCPSADANAPGRQRHSACTVSTQQIATEVPDGRRVARRVVPCTDERNR